MTGSINIQQLEVNQVLKTALFMIQFYSHEINCSALSHIAHKQNANRNHATATKLALHGPTKFRLLQINMHMCHKPLRDYETATILMLCV